MSYAYVLWFILHLSLFIFSAGETKYTYNYRGRTINNPHYHYNDFYPFDRNLTNVFIDFPHVGFSLSNSYDFSELFFYTVLFPIIIFVTVKIFPYISRYIKETFTRLYKFYISKKRYSLLKGEELNINDKNSTEKNVTGIKKYDVDSARGERPILQVPKVKTMPLFRRFVGSMIDKILLLIIFIVGYLFISPYGAPGKLGTYHGLLSASPNVYEYIDKAEMKRYNSGKYSEGISKEFQDRERLENKPPHIGSTKELDMSITFSFILLNLIYYVLFESILSASLGKFVFRGKLQNCNNEKVSFVRVFARAFCGGLFMTIAVLFLHFQLGLSYYYVFLLFFFVMDIPVLFVKRSLLDICTGTKYVQRN